MTEDVFQAVQQLQQLCCKYFYSSPYWTERTDRAISSILRNPSKSGNPDHLVRNTLSDARKILHRRNEICSFTKIKMCDDDFGHDIETIPDFRFKNLETVFQYEDWLERACLSDRDKIILNLLFHGSEAQEVAEKLGITIEQARVQISRTRKRAKACWESDINV
ncbi:MAG: sigma-70 family RNA polymerase sigma factor [Rivularia sp. (in: Bacteria)]|nr:sigma-70 family RNA polymerase sigma factor [Rivularia sp. MS3]